MTVTHTPLPPHDDVEPEAEQTFIVGDADDVEPLEVEAIVEEPDEDMDVDVEGVSEEEDEEEEEEDEEEEEAVQVEVVPLFMSAPAPIYWNAVDGVWELHEDGDVVPLGPTHPFPPHHTGP